MVNARLGKPDGLAMLVLFSLHSNELAALAINNPIIVAIPNFIIFETLIFFIPTSNNFYSFFPSSHHVMISVTLIQVLNVFVKKKTFEQFF